MTTMYRVQAQILTHEKDDRGNEWHGSRQVPTFEINPLATTVLNESAAEVVARNIIDPMGTLDVTLTVVRIDT